MTMKWGKETVTVVAVSVCFFLFAYLVDFSVDSLVNLENSLLKSALQSSSVAGTLSLFVPSFLAMIFLVLGFMLLAGYALGSNDKKFKARNIGLACGVIGAGLALFIFHFTITSLFIAVALIISCVYIIPLSRAYDQEFKKWKFFRVGSNSASRVLLIFNILVAVGILLAVSVNMSYYQNSFATEMSSVIRNASTEQAVALADNYISSYRASAIAAIDQTYPNLPSAQRQLLIDGIDQQVRVLRENMINEVEKKSDKLSRSAIESMPLFRAYVTWLPIITALAVFVVLEFLRSLVFTNIAGLFAAITIRLYRKR